MLDFARDYLDIVAPAGDLIYSDSFELHDGGCAQLHSRLVRQMSPVCPAIISPSAPRAPTSRSGYNRATGRCLRKLVITSRDVVNAPQFSVLIDAWDQTPDLDEDLFHFEPPEDAMVIDFMVLSANRRMMQRRMRMNQQHPDFRALAFASLPVASGSWGWKSGMAVPFSPWLAQKAAQAVIGVPVSPDVGWVVWPVAPPAARWHTPAQPAPQLPHRLPPRPMPPPLKPRLPKHEAAAASAAGATGACAGHAGRHRSQRAAARLHLHDH